MPTSYILTEKGQTFVADYDTEYERNTELTGMPSRNYSILSNLVAGPKEISEIDFGIPSYTKIPATTLRRKLKEFESQGYIEKW